MSKKPVVLMILDGYGLNDKTEGNAIAMTNAFYDAPTVITLFVQLVCRMVRWVTPR